jgi:hypothetical protein
VLEKECLGRFGKERLQIQIECEQNPVKKEA